MGLTAGAVSSSASSSSAAGVSSATSLLSPVGLGVGSVFVAAALILLLAYYDVIDASDIHDDRTRTMLGTAIAPLLVAFIADVAYSTLGFLG